MYRVKSNYELKDIDEKGVVTAYVSIFDNIDSDGDKIVKGAFAKTISERGPGAARPRIKHLWMHQPWEVIGVPLEMSEDDEGLMVRSKFGTDSYSQDKLQQHKDGLITEFSIGFEPISEGETTDQEGNTYNEMREIKLWEYSSVTWGANALTYTVEAKGVKKAIDELNDRMDKLVKALRNGRYSDESAEQFEMELKQIQTIYNELSAKERPLSDSTPHGPGDEPTLTVDEIKMIFNELKL